MLKDAEVFAYVPVVEMARARNFYENIVGLAPDNPSEHGTTYKCAGGTAFFAYVTEFAGTSKASTLFWTVDDIDTEVKQLKANGVVFEHYESNEWMTVGDDDIARFKDETGATPAAWFKDPDGNVLALIQS